MEMADLRDAKKVELLESRQKQWELQKDLDKVQEIHKILKRKLTEALEEEQRLKNKVKRMQEALDFERSGRQSVHNERQKCRGEIEALQQQIASLQQDTGTSAMAQKLLQDISTRSLLGSHAHSPSKQIEDLMEARDQELNREFEERDKERERLHQEATAQLRQEREELRQKEIDRQAKGEKLEALLLARDKKQQEAQMRMREQIEVVEYTQTHTFVRLPSCTHISMSSVLIRDIFVQKVEQLLKEKADVEKERTDWQSQLSSLDKEWESAITKKNEEISELRQFTTQVEWRISMSICI